MDILWVRRADKMQALLFYWMRTLDTTDRDLLLSWSAMHLFGSARLAKLLALQRGLDADLAAWLGALHGIAKPDEQARWNRLCQALSLAAPFRGMKEQRP